jgi:ATP-dependent DNA helicase 2 subunit 2
MAMGEASIIVSQKANHEAAAALSSLIHALYESETYALARLVRKDGVPPLMVLLAPNIEAEFESLLEVALPFAEDVRQYKFAPLDRIKTSRGEITEQHRYLPSKKLSDAMDEYKRRRRAIF